MRRTALLRAARDRFVADGYSSTPVSAIVRDAGVAQGTFYLYFDSKQAVLAELRRQVFRDYADTLDRVMDLGCPVDEAIARVIVAMAAAVERNLSLERVFRHAETAEATLDAARAGRARLARVAAEQLALGNADGTVRVASPELAARFLITLHDHILYEALVYEPDRVDDVVVESVRFGLQALGVAPERIESLLTERVVWQRDERAIDAHGEGALDEPRLASEETP